MKTIGFVISHKENEHRRALLPNDIRLHVAHPEMLLVESSYGEALGFSDEDYRSTGAKIVPRDVAMSADIICDPKIGDADYLDQLHGGQTIFGWVHAVQNRDITDSIIRNGLSAIAWEDMFYKGRHLFWRNNEIAGEAAIMHAFSLHGIFPYDTTVAIIGRGNVAQGANRILTSLGADITVYNRHNEDLLREEIGKFDVIVNCVLWDTHRTDHIVYRDDLKRMKKGALIIDISCDRNGGIQTSIPTTIENPTYVVDNVTHYVVDHTPSIFYKSVSKSLSAVCSQFINQLIEDKLGPILSKALIIKDGVIIDQRIKDFQKR